MSHKPFIFNNGKKAKNIQQLLELSIKYPDDAIVHFKKGHFIGWLNYIGEPELAKRLSGFKEGKQQQEQYGWLLLGLASFNRSGTKWLDGAPYILTSHLKDLKNLPAPSPIKAHLKALGKRLEFLLHRKEKQVVFFGVFNAGKSTLINALLEIEILPSHANRATGVITSLQYGDIPEAKVFQNSIKGTSVKDITIDELESYIRIHLSNGEVNAPEDIIQVRLSMPAPILKKWTLIDTLGIKDSEAFSKKTFEALREADLAIAVLDATQILSIDEKNAIIAFQEILNGNIIVVVNRWDETDPDDREELMEYILTELEGIGNQYVGSPKVFSTSALAALQQNNEVSAKGVSHLKAWLEWFAQQPECAAAILNGRLGRWRKLLLECITMLEAEAAVYQEKRELYQAARHKRTQKAQKEFEETVDRARLSYIKLQSKIYELEDEFVADCIEYVNDLMDKDNSWGERAKIKNEIVKAVNNYAKGITRATRKSLKVPGFSAHELKIYKNDISFEIAESFAGLIGGVVGGGLGLFGGIWGAIAGATIGSAAGELISGRDVKSETLDSLKSGARSHFSTLAQEANNYVIKQKKRFDQYVTGKTIVLEDTLEEKALKKHIEQIETLIEYLEHMVTEVEEINQLSQIYE